MSATASGSVAARAPRTQEDFMMRCVVSVEVLRRFSQADIVDHRAVGNVDKCCVGSQHQSQVKLFSRSQR